MTKYHISYCRESFLSDSTSFHDDIIDEHPLLWRAKHDDETTLIAWNEIPEDINEKQLIEFEKERDRRRDERAIRLLKGLG